MTGKRKSKDHSREAQRSEADLGQKEAKLEKASEEELRYMEGRGVAAKPTRQQDVASKVQIAMHKGVVWVGPDTTVAEVARLMRKHDIGAIPIGENDRLLGMVTDRDIVCKGVTQDDFDVRRARARDVMTPGIHCCREDDDLAQAVRHMEELKVRRLPVINKSKRMVGMLALGDISYSAADDLLAECTKSVSAHHP